MNSAQRCLWRYYLLALLQCAMLVSLLVFSPITAIPLVFAIVLALPIFAKRLRDGRLGFRPAWLWRLTWSVRRFRTLSTADVQLHYSPGFEEWYDLTDIQRTFEKTLRRLSRQFGFRLRGRPSIYLFSTIQQVAEVFGPLYAGTALAGTNSIFISCGGNQCLHELIRHELTHLFAARWSTQVPPLISEGLAVWCQKTENGNSIDELAWPLIVQPGISLTQLLNTRVFFSDRYRNNSYILAGSFTGYLIRAFGWERFRALYRKCSVWNFRTSFHKCYGLRLEIAESRWHRQLPEI